MALTVDTMHGPSSEMCHQLQQRTSYALYITYRTEHGPIRQCIDTIPYDTGLEAPFAHSLHSVYFRKFTPCCLPRLTF